MTFKVKLKKAPVPDDRARELNFFQKAAGLEFKNIRLLENAFTHSSYANEKRQPEIVDNERLEFLGDGILDMVVAMWLYDNVNVQEGSMSKIRSTVVCESALAEIARKLDVGRLLLLGKGEEATGGRNKDAILADCVESIIAAVYLDKGFDDAYSFVMNIVGPYLPEAVASVGAKDYKTLLQEYCQKKWKVVPTYTLCGTEGPNHDQTFKYSVSVNGNTYGPAQGHNKKTAEQAAAKLAYQVLCPEA